MKFANTLIDPLELALAYYRLGTILWAEEQFAASHDALLVAIDKIEKTTAKELILFVGCVAGVVECFKGNPLKGMAMINADLENLKRDYPTDTYDFLPWFAHALWLEKDIPRAKQIYLEALEGLNKMRWFVRIPECLEGLGKIAVAQNQLERAARLFGAAEAMREKMGTPIPPVMRGDYEAHVQRLGNAFEAAWSQGRGMMMENIIEFAVRENAP